MPTWPETAAATSTSPIPCVSARRSEVLRATEQLLVSTWPQIELAPVEQAFADFDALFAGRMPGYAGVDTRLSRPTAHARCHAGDGAPARRLRATGRGCAATRSRARRARRDPGAVSRRRLSAPQYAIASRPTAPNSRAVTSAAAAEFLRTICRRSVSATGARWPRRSFTSPATSGRSTQIVTHDARDTRAGAPARHRRHDRAAGRSLLSGEVPRPAVSGIRARRRGTVGRRQVAAPEVQYASGLDLLRQTPGFVANTRATRLDRDFDARLSLSSKCCSRAAIPTSSPSTATCSISSRYCAARAGACCAGIRRCMRPIRRRSGRVRSLMLGYFKKAWLQD